MKMSDISFPTTEQTPKFKNRKLSFRSSLSKNDFGGLGMVFTLSH